MLLLNMRAAGIDPNKIDIVLLTHIHADHSGGLTVGGIMQFPHAMIYVDKRDVELFINRALTATDSTDMRRIVTQSRATIGPYLTAGKVVLIRHDGQIIPGIVSRSQPGHTPGHTAYLVESGEHKMLFWGDIVHSAEVQFGTPNVSVIYDIDPAEAITHSDFVSFSSQRILGSPSHRIIFPFQAWVMCAKWPPAMLGCRSHTARLSPKLIRNKAVIVFSFAGWSASLLRLRLAIDTLSELI